jgi:D-alanyl-D-alanine carboxypeptidase
MYYLKSVGSALFLSVTALLYPARAQTEAATAQLQQIVDSYVSQHAATEGFSGVALRVSLGGSRPAIFVTAGSNGLPDAAPMTSNTLFEIGSNTKSFTSSLILLLEAAGRLNIDQTVGDWLPQYPAWKSVTIRALLNMTSRIPSYDSTLAMNELQVDLNYQFTPEQLIAFVNPDQGSSVPPTPVGYNYTNTGYFLASLIIERASGMSYRRALERWIIKPLHLHHTYYVDGPIPGYVLDRMTAGFFNDPTCEAYQPNPTAPGCVSTLAPLLGKDVHTENLSWAGPAGGIIATLGDLAQWYRALFGLRVVAQAQLVQMESLVSTSTGLPIATTTTADPVGYGLGLTQADLPQFDGRIWYYEGETAAMRVVYGYWPRYDLVITMVANSNVSDKVGMTFPVSVLSSAVTALVSSGVVQASAEDPSN